SNDSYRCVPNRGILSWRNFHQTGRCITFGRDQISGGRDDRECPPPVQEEGPARGHHQGGEETLLLLETGGTKTGQAGFGPKAKPEEGSPGFRINRRAVSHLR